MIWKRTASDHTAAIGSFARQWLGGTILDRLILVTLVGWIWCAILVLFALLTRSPEIFLLCLLLSFIPWVFLLLDAKRDAQIVAADTESFKNEGAILATRCEYLGGHPELPHGRFAYLLLEGTRQRPSLTVVFPQPLGTPAERFALPLLDLTKTRHEPGSDASIAADIGAAINKDAGRMLRPERLTLVVDYDGAAGRKHKVELTNFFHGNNEIRNWRNYLVCAQAEADTGVVPHTPWVSLSQDPEASAVEASKLEGTTELEGSHAFSRNGHTVEDPSSAFVRR